MASSLDMGFSNQPHLVAVASSHRRGETDAVLHVIGAAFHIFPPRQKTRD